MNSHKKIILLGGSFDPIHYGHLKIVLNAIKQTKANEGWFILAKQAPLKSTTQLRFSDRAEMVKIMLSPYRHLKLCRIEEHLPTPSYTIDTLTQLQILYPNYTFIYLIGSDQANNFKQWKDYQAILDRVEVMVYPRSTQDIIDDQMFTRLYAPILDISSTEIRQGKALETHPKILSTMITRGYYSLEMIQQNLPRKRVEHSVSVAQLAQELAKSHSIDPQKAYAVGLIHDWFKPLTTHELLPYLNAEYLNQPDYLHHAYGLAQYLAKVYYVRDRSFINAIYHHVTGKGQSKLAKILFIADKAEPLRKYPTQEYRNLAFKDLNKVVQKIQYDINELEKG